ncbi:hypothetical protein GCM10023174_15400 [Chelativorans composti]
MDGKLLAGRKTANIHANQDAATTGGNQRGLSHGLSLQIDEAGCRLPAFRSHGKVGGNGKRRSRYQHKSTKHRFSLAMNE